MPIKILLLSNNFHPFVGGIEVNSEILAQAFVNKGHEVTLLTWSKDPGNKSFPFKVIRAPELKEIMQAHSWADVVFENNPCLKLSWPGLFYRRPSVVVLNTWISHKDGANKLQEKVKLFWLKRADEVIAVSHALRKGIYPKATVIVNPYRKKLFRNLPEVNRTRDFVFLGRLVSDKGARLAIKAIYLLKKAKRVEKNLGVEPNLTIIGEGEEEENLKNLTAKLDLTDNVHFKGILVENELVKCLNQHRFIMIPSVWEEPFGMVALEGMACGCLPIASDVGGLPESVGRAGIFFRKGDIEDLAYQTKKLLRNPALEKNYREKIKRHLEYHQAQYVTKNYLEVIEKLTSN